MEPLLTMDQQEYVQRMQAECRRMLEQVADAVNHAPTNNVISGSEMQVRELLAEFRKTAFQTAIQMRIDSHESSFSPSGGRGGGGAGEQGPRTAEHADGQRADPVVPSALGRRVRRQRPSGGPAAR